MRTIPIRGRRRWLTVLASAMLVGSLGYQTVSAAKPVEPTFVDYAQCANGEPPSVSLGCPEGWINGILQASNSHYAEDQVTPQRAEVNVPAGATPTHTMTFTYQARKGSAQTHAYDSLATWNWTQREADRCDGLSAPDCPGGAFSAFPIPDDPQILLPFTAPSTGVTTPHMLPLSTQAECNAYDPEPAGGTYFPSRCMVMYGGTITNISVPVHDCVVTTNCSDPSVDDYAAVTVTYTVSALPAKVQLLFGGHLALGSSGGSRTWGLGNGASNISGGPYHIKWTASDGASIGNRDNQIMGSAIIFNDTGISTTPNPTGGTVPLLLNDSATLAGATPTAGGTITFNLYPPADATCTGSPSYTQVVNVSGPGTYSTSPGFTATVAGAWNWTADYSGDGNNAASSSGCGAETVTIIKASPSITTQASPTTDIVVGSTVTAGDTATVTGGYNPSGSVTFTLYSESTCNTAASPALSGSGTISGGSASFSGSWTPTSIGTYYWIASYAGDGNNNGFTTTCGDANEQLTVIKASPGGSTAPAAQIRDTFTISGGYNPTGTVDFSLWTENTCSVGTAVDTDTGVALTGGSATSKWMSVGSDTYFWKTVYGGDNFNNSVTLCGEQTIVTLP